MFEAKARDYLQGAFHHFLVLGTDVPEAVQLVFSIELLTISSMSEVRSEHKVLGGLPKELQRVFSSTKVT